MSGGRQPMRTGVARRKCSLSHETSPSSIRTQPCERALPSGSSGLAPERP